MEDVFVYFLKANGLIITFYLAYYFLLRKETFFNKNRWFLLSGLALSIVLPLITFSKIVWIEPNPIVYQTEILETLPNIIQQPVEKTIDWNIILVYLYFGFSSLFILKLIIELFSFFKIIKLGTRNKSKHTILVDNPKNENPFSFFKYIIINKTAFTNEELDHIITHETIHVKEKHSIDVLISQLFCALFWINPIIWLYRKEMLQNLEFIADNKASKQAENKINYQKTLLKVVTNQHQLTITNQFYQSLIKKRIVMLNTNQSNQKKSWKYALILPVLSAFMLLFQVETVAQVKEKIDKEAVYAVSTGYSSILTKDSSDKDLKELQQTFSGENQKLIISNVKRNKNGEIIEIKLVFDTGKTYNQVLERKSSEGIKDIKIYVNEDDADNKTCGFEEMEDEAFYAAEVLDEELLVVDGSYSEENNKFWSLDNMTKNGKEVVLIINGKIKGANEEVKLQMNEELGEMKEITPAEFEKKYNQKADSDKYYYEVETVKLKTVVGKWDDAIALSENQKTKPTNKTYENTKYKVTSEFSEDFINKHIITIKNNKNVDYKKALLIYDGKEINHEELEKINPKIIAGSSIMTANKNSINKYGEKAKNGVIELKSQKYLEETDEIYMKVKKEYENKKQIELKAQENASFSKEEIEERRIKLEERKEEREKLLKERKIKLEEKKEERKNLLDKINYVQFILSNGDGIIVLENNRIKIPEFPTTILKKVSLYFNDKKISESDFIKMNYDLIKSIKVINNQGSTETFKPIREIYFYSK